MTSYTKYTITEMNQGNYSGLAIYNSNILIYGEYNYNKLCTISATQTPGQFTQLGSDNPLSGAPPGSIGVFGNYIYAFNAQGGSYNFYTMGGDWLSSPIFDINLNNVTAIGNMYLYDDNTAYVASTYQTGSGNNSYVYKIGNIRSGTLSVSPIITISLGKQCNIGGVTSDGTNLYVAYVNNEVNDVYVNVLKIPFADLGSPLTITTGNFGNYSYYNVSSVTKPVRCDCFYFENLLYVLASQTVIMSEPPESVQIEPERTEIYSRATDGSVVHITTGSATINAASNTFTVGKSSYGIKLFVATEVASIQYHSMFSNGLYIYKIYPTTAPTEAQTGGDPHMKPIFGDTTYIIPNTLNCYNYFDSLNTSINERFIVNSKLWIIDYNFIANMTNINDEVRIRDHVKYNDVLETDSGFNRYISLIYKLNSSEEYLIIDTESLDCVLYDDILINKYELNISDDKYRFFNISKIVTSDDQHKINITLNTIMYGTVSIMCIKYKYKKNHRNDFNIVFSDGTNLKTSGGALLHIKDLHEIPHLLYVENDTNKSYDTKVLSLDQHKELIKTSNLPKMKKMRI